MLYYSLWSLLTQYRSSAWEVIATAVWHFEGSLAEFFKIYTSFQKRASFFRWSVAAQIIYVKFSYKTRHKRTEAAALPCYWAKSEINHECVSGGTKNQKTQRIYTAWADSPGCSPGCSHINSTISSNANKGCWTGMYIFIASYFLSFSLRTYKIWARYKRRYSRFTLALVLRGQPSLLWLDSSHKPEQAPPTMFLTQPS